MTDILLFAAGLGTRMGALTAHQPKPLVRVGGQTLIDHALALTQVPLIGRRVVNAHYKADQLRHHLQGQAITISDETDLLRDTGGGLRHALPHLNGDPVMTLNTDAIWVGPNPIPLLQAAWREEMSCLLMLVPRDNVQGHKGAGDYVADADGRLSRAHGPIYSGLQMVRRTGLDAISEDVFSMNRIWDDAEQSGKLFGISYPGHWCDVGQPDSIPLAENMMAAASDV